MQSRVVRSLDHFCNLWGRQELAHISLRRHPHADREEKPLFLFIVERGLSTTPSRLFITAGLHGVEGCAGIQLFNRWLEGGGLARIPRDIGVTIVPNVNPWGMARGRRTNEDNIDLNRNFLDGWDALPINEGYAALHAALVPRQWEDETRQAADEKIRAFIAQEGMRAFQQAVTQGQHEFPGGLFYGGRMPSWSHVEMLGVFRRLALSDRIAHLDIHTGLGPFGVAEVICPVPSEHPASARTKRWFGDAVKAPFGGDSVSAPITGHMAGALMKILPNIEVTTVALEIGTYPIQRVLDALRAEQVWWNLGRPEGEWGGSVQAEMLEVFCPSDPAWWELAQNELNTRIDQAVAGLLS